MSANILKLWKEQQKRPVNPTGYYRLRAVFFPLPKIESSKYPLMIFSKLGEIPMFSFLICTQSFFIFTICSAWSVNSNVNSPVVSLQQYSYTGWNCNLHWRKITLVHKFFFKPHVIRHQKFFCFWLRWIHLQQIHLKSNINRNYRI